MHKLAAFLSIALFALVASYQSTPRADAIFHIAVIDEVMSGFDGDPDVQFMEVRMDFPGQHLVNDTRLTAWNADGSSFDVVLLLPNDVPNDGVDVRWIAATQAFADLTGMTPDFIMPPGFNTPGGMICWGAPDFAPPSGSWDPQFPFLYTDCVAYGNYSGGNSIHPPPFSLAPGDGERSLQRLLPLPPGGGSGEAAHLASIPDADAFALRCPSPENNAGVVVLMGVDDDDDDLPNCHEGEVGTNPNDPDSDDDGFTDGEEVAAGSDPLDPNSIPAGEPTPTETATTPPTATSTETPTSTPTSPPAPVGGIAMDVDAATLPALAADGSGDGLARTWIAAGSFAAAVALGGVALHARRRR